MSPALIAEKRADGSGVAGSFSRSCSMEDRDLLCLWAWHRANAVEARNRERKGGFHTASQHAIPKVHAASYA